MSKLNVALTYPSNGENWVACQRRANFASPSKRDFPPEADLPMAREKQGKFGSDAPAACVALYSCMRKHGNGADEPKSPTPFSNEIRAAIHDNR